MSKGDMIMSNFNQDILKRNIKALLKNKDITQQQLADVIGMSQSNVSKALSKEEKKSFTVEQIYSIASHFGVSIDWLLGYKTAQQITMGPKAVGAFLAELLSTKEAKLTPVEINDSVYVIDYDPRSGYPNCKIVEQVNTYLALYFPNFWNPRELAKNEDDFFEMHDVASQSGNDTRNIPINIFLKKYSDILKVFNDDQISEEAYQIVLKDYLNQLREF